jgi:HAMP domain-containing protein
MSWQTGIQMLMTKPAIDACVMSRGEALTVATAAARASQQKRRDEARARVAQVEAGSDKHMTDAAIAAELGLAKSYVNRLRRELRKCQG